MTRRVGASLPPRGAEECVASSARRCSQAADEVFDQVRYMCRLPNLGSGNPLPRGLGPDKSIAICGRVSCRFNRSSSRQGNLARQSFRAPVEAHFAVQLASNHALHHARAEAAARRRLDGRAACFIPTKDESAVRCARPLDVHAVFGDRQGPILAALVASSCNITAMICAVFGSSNRSAPAIRTRVSPSTTSRNFADGLSRAKPRSARNCEPAGSRCIR